MVFVPTFCPYADCSLHGGGSGAWYQSRGSYRRYCDGQVVARFSCKSCRRRFSRQSFRLNYRWWRPHVHHELFRLFTAKVTMRQAARMTRLARETVARRMSTLGLHCERFHEAVLQGTEHGLSGSFLMDELETFETDRLVRPVTVPVIVQRTSHLVVHLAVGRLAPRGRLNTYRRLRRERDEFRFGPRRCESRKTVRTVLERLAAALGPSSALNLTTDRKSSYRPLVQSLFASNFGSHARVSSKQRRDRSNPLFPINHTLAMMRDGVSRLVRRSWAAAKLRERLREHLWIWACYRNYIRGITVKAPRVTPAMVAGLRNDVISSSELLRWRWPARHLGLARPAD